MYLSSGGGGEDKDVRGGEVPGSVQAAVLAALAEPFIGREHVREEAEGRLGLHRHLRCRNNTFKHLC